MASSLCIYSFLVSYLGYLLSLLSALMPLKPELLPRGLCLVGLISRLHDCFHLERYRSKLGPFQLEAIQHYFDNCHQVL